MVQDSLRRREAEAAIAFADLRVLLMCLFHTTADERWLREPFQPKRDVRLIADPSAGLSAEAQAAVRRAAVDLFGAGPVGPRITVVDDQLMTRLMSVCLGEPVPSEYAPMMRRELGLTAPAVGASEGTVARAGAADGPLVTIIGAGVSGLAMGAELTRRGIPYVIFEQSDEVGGTWNVNRYPGCGVDTPSHAYSFSFGRRFPWTSYFAKRQEVLEYLRRCSKEFGVRPSIRFGTTVVGARWSEEHREWEVDIRDAEGHRTVRSPVLVSALGLLSVPKRPQIPGSDTFMGEQVHAAEWPETLDVRGRHVAVVGTGATGVQLVPGIVDEVAGVTVFQRSPSWVRPVEGYGEEMPTGARWLMDNAPYYAAWFRLTMFWRFGDAALRTLRKDPAWPHPERAMNRRNDLHREELTAYIRRVFADRPDLMNKVLPTYPVFGKRLILDGGWYESLLRPNVVLCDLPIASIRPEGVVDAAGTLHLADVLVYATGFEVSRLTAALEIQGRDGVLLADAWANQNPTAYLGISVPDFPNLFCMLGPNSGLAHGGSVIFQAECQARYIALCLDAMWAKGADAVEVRREPYEEYVRRVDEEHRQLVWVHPGMSNWYRNPTGRVVGVMPWRLVDYWHMTESVDLDHFRLTAASAVRTP